MRKLLLLGLVLSSTVNAQVIVCPAHLPDEDMRLSKAPAVDKGHARLRPAGLSSAGIQASKLYGYPVDVPPPSRKVKGGWETEYRFTPDETKWLVCRYGGDGNGFTGGAITENVEWWRQLAPEATSCVLSVREIKKKHTRSNYTATATCK